VFRSGTKRGQFRNDAGRTSFSWLRPAFFTLFGAALGFVAVKYATVESEGDKRAFLRAVWHGTGCARCPIDGSLPDVKGAKERVEGKGTQSQFALALRTSVFASQIGKLSDVDDPLLIDIVHFIPTLAHWNASSKASTENKRRVTRAEAFHAKKTMFDLV